MPELPDVEIFRRYLDKSTMYKLIDDIDVQNDHVLAENTSARKLESVLKGSSIVDTSRHGKNLFVDFDNGKHLRLHFGMTGGLELFHDDSNEPEYTRVRFDFSDGDHLAFTDMRMLGAVELVPSADDYIRNEHLGPDAATVSYEDFRSIAMKKRGAAKSFLMDQSALAGIGNVYSDEILFQSKIHPLRNVHDLSAAELKKLYGNMRDVLRTAISRHADPDKLPASYLIPRRKRGAKCPRCATKLNSMKVNSRTAWYCPRCQKQSRG